MNVIFWIILIALLAEFIIGFLSTLLNVRSLDPKPPAGVEDVYESNEYRRSQAYTRTLSNFGLVVSSFKFVVLLGFWLIGGFNYLDDWIRLMQWSQVWTGIVFIGLLTIGDTILGIPFSMYSTFVIEDRFGFNKTTYSTYLFDNLKGIFLSAIIGVPLLFGVLYFFEYAGGMAWLYVWVLIVGFSLIVQIIAPIWIMPIFNKFTPLSPGELRDAIIDYAESVAFKYGNIYVIDGSKRSAHSNAFFTGFGKTKRIALFDTLVETLTPEEIVAVIAHEVGHNKRRHIIYNMITGVLHTGILLFLLSIMMENQLLFDAFLMENTSIYGTIVFFGLLFTPVGLVISPLLGLISRKHEYEADLWAVDTITDRQFLVSGLKKLAATNLSNLSPNPLFVALNYSHPPLADRIKKINRHSVTKT